MFFSCSAGCWCWGKGAADPETMLLLPVGDVPWALSVHTCEIGAMPLLLEVAEKINITPLLHMLCPVPWTE